MILTCPCCGCRASAEAWENDADQRQFMELLASLPRPVSTRLLRYCGLFRGKGANRAMAWKKALRIARELADLVATGYVQGKGKVARPCSPDRWGAGIDTMIEMASTGQLSLPMKSHNYLVAIVWQEADKADATAESKYHAQAQTGIVRHPQAISHTVDDGGPNKYELAYEQQYGAGSLDDLSDEETIDKVKQAVSGNDVASAVSSIIHSKMEKNSAKRDGYSSKERSDFFISLDTQLKEVFLNAGRGEQHRIMRLPAEQRHDAVRELI